MGEVAQSMKPPIGPRPTPDANHVRLLFYVGVPGMTALLFGLNHAGMARLLPTPWAIPYWLGLAIPLWALLDLSSRAVHMIFARFDPHRWLVLLGGSLVAMALFSPYVMAYTSLISGALLDGAEYRVSIPFPEAFLDLRRFAAFSGVPIYWIVVALFFARYFGFPPYLVPTGARETEAAIASAPPATNAYGLVERTGFRALLPYHLGTDIVSLSAEDHYLRVCTDQGNALIRYRFGDALREVADIPGIQAHRSHWVAVRSIARIQSDGKNYRLILADASEIPVSRTNVGVLKAARLL